MVAKNAMQCNVNSVVAIKILPFCAKDRLQEPGHHAFAQWHRPVAALNSP